MVVDEGTRLSSVTFQNVENSLFGIMCLLSLKSNANLHEIFHTNPVVALVPQQNLQVPLVVYTEIYLEDLNSFKPVTMDFRLDFFLKHHWTVAVNVCFPHLESLADEFQNAREHTQLNDPEVSVIINTREIKRLWLPDTYIGNSKVVETPAKDSSTSSVVFRISKERCVLEYTLRLAAIVSCQMDFKHYPADKQVCPFHLRSFSYPKEMVMYAWDQDGPPPVNPEMRMLRHRVTITKGRTEKHLLNVTYSMLYINLTFERDLAHHLIQVFTPSALIVMLSWLSFWVGLEATPGRITLCVTSLLALITQFSSIRRDLPPLSYIHGVDIWMVTCMCFVFASLLEFTVVIYIDHQRRTKNIFNRHDLLNLETNFLTGNFIDLKRATPRPLLSTASDSDCNRRLLKKIKATPKMWSSPDIRAALHPLRKPPRDWVHTIDKASRLLFPLAFLMYNTFYWAILLSR